MSLKTTSPGESTITWSTFHGMAVHGTLHNFLNFNSPKRSSWGKFHPVFESSSTSTITRLALTLWRHPSRFTTMLWQLSRRPWITSSSDYQVSTDQTLPQRCWEGLERQKKCMVTESKTIGFAWSWMALHSLVKALGPPWATVLEHFVMLITTASRQTFLSWENPGATKRYASFRPETTHPYGLVKDLQAP